MQYFEASDGKPERIGKVIGDTLAALVILAVLILAFNSVPLNAPWKNFNSSALPLPSLLLALLWFFTRTFVSKRAVQF